ncbi:hypothetical protein BH23DEI1_BH23DEI1_05910 [soil metagenome]|nr:hypothetical protein [Trueperaceae bacterium]
MNVPRGPLAPFLAADEPSLAVATQALRFVFLGLFGAQVTVALALGATVAAFVPQRPAPHDVFALVLVAMAALHVPLAWLLSAAARRSGGKQAALSSTVLGGVLASVPAWFAALMLISGQRSVYLLFVMTILAAAYALGFIGAGRAAVAATRPIADAGRERS